MVTLSLMLLMALCLTAECAAGPPKPVVTFYTEPPRAVVSDQFGDLGVSGEPLQLRDSYQGGDIQLTFMLEGYHPETRTLSAGYFDGRRFFPEGAAGRPGVLRLRPASPGAYLHAYRLPIVGSAVALGLVLAVLAGSAGRLRAARQRAEQLEEIQAQADEDAPMAGRTLGGYRLVRTLGRGGMATVYEAVPNADLGGEAVALKVLDRRVSRGKEFTRRFQREIQLCQKLVHPNVVQLIDWGVEDDYTFLVLELVQGGTLRHRLVPGGLPPGEVGELAGALFKAVGYAHARGVVHRDLKPENVLITSQGVPKVGDFGLGRAEESESVTKSGEALGTPAYMSPEQIAGAAFEPASDQYALGVILFELLTGRRPFDHPDPVQLIFQHMSTKPPAPSAYRDLPPSVDAVVLRMLAKAVEERFPGLADAAQAFSEALAEWEG